MTFVLAMSLSYREGNFEVKTWKIREVLTRIGYVAPGSKRHSLSRSLMQQTLIFLDAE
jgi:hypothetical protein